MWLHDFCRNQHMAITHLWSEIDDVCKRCNSCSRVWVLRSGRAVGVQQSVVIWQQPSTPSLYPNCCVSRACRPTAVRLSAATWQRCIKNESETCCSRHRVPVVFSVLWLLSFRLMGRSLPGQPQQAGIITQQPHAVVEQTRCRHRRLLLLVDWLATSLFQSLQSPSGGQNNSKLD
jgi:hypothetical protein